MTTTISPSEDCDECRGTAMRAHDRGDVNLCRGHYTFFRARIAGLEVRIAELESGINLPGWWCLAIRESGVQCGTFNGEAKEKHVICRMCEKAKADIPTRQ